MVIKILDLAPSATTTEDGTAVYQALSAAIGATRDSTIEVSFLGVSIATSSFVNTSFVPLLDLVSFDEIKKRVRIINSNRQINDMIKSRMEKEAAARIWRALSPAGMTRMAAN
jgi:hypothetical protein